MRKAHPSFNRAEQVFNGLSADAHCLWRTISAPLHRFDDLLIFRATGNLRAAQILLGHTKIENTAGHLGVDVEDALIHAERTEI